LRIAIGQPEASPDARVNGASARRLMHAAHAEGARLLQLPEGHLSGYPKEQVSDWADVDWAAVADELRLVQELAAELRLWVVVGSAHPTAGRPFNSLYVVGDDGALVGRYDKRILSATETRDWYRPGAEPLTFEVDGFRFGCATCIEVNFPELFAEYERADVECVLLSAYPVDASFALKGRAHAAINCYWLALSVPGQTEPFCPGALYGPDGSELAVLHDELAVADLDRGDPRFDIALTKARPWRREARASRT
jgi:predicted amidohydrolase